MSKKSAPSSVLNNRIRIGSAQRRIVDILKKHPASATATLAKSLGVTSAAIRLQLNELQENGLVMQSMTPTQGRGRPSAAWSLTEQAIDLFPDRHGDLTVELIQSIRGALGEDALTKVLAERDQHLLSQLNEATPAEADFDQKAAVLTKLRTRMGYMAELEKDGKALLLTEHHCPVCAAASECQGLCRNELQLFQNYMGENVSVERIQHLLSGNSRCVYRMELLIPD